jgi:hypothetical protein
MHRMRYLHICQWTGQADSTGLLILHMAIASDVTIHKERRTISTKFYRFVSVPVYWNGMHPPGVISEIFFRPSTYESTASAFGIIPLDLKRLKLSDEGNKIIQT